MIKTFDIDLDENLVDEASKVFEELGTDIDAAIKIFLKQAILRKGFPFEVVIPQSEGLTSESKDTVTEQISDNEENSEKLDKPETKNVVEPNIVCSTELHGGITEEEEAALALAAASPISSSAGVAEKVAANEAIVAEMRDEIGNKDVTPEFDENEDDGTYGNYEIAPSVDKSVVEENSPNKSEEVVIDEAESSDMKNVIVEEQVANEAENVIEETESTSSEELIETEDDDEDETTPDSLFDAWDVGEEEDIGCR